jgi:methionine-gamma-lyase
MKYISTQHGISTLVTHFGEGDNAYYAHIAPIYQTSTFGFPDAETAGKVFAGDQEGYFYTRSDNPNAAQLAKKITMLEALELLQQQPNEVIENVAMGKVFASGMAAISAAILGRAQAGDTIMTQRILYGNSYRFMNELAPRLGLKVVWVDKPDQDGWESAFEAHPHAVLVYAETPANPALDIVDLHGLAEIAHAHKAWLIADNTFATPYHQRPLSLGCDVVVHSTTKYLAGHGFVIGGALISTQLEYVSAKGGVGLIGRVMGAAPSPFDCWLANIGLKTFELRMRRHADNAMTLARWLSEHPKIKRVYYPGLEEHPGHAIAARQMINGFGGMISFEPSGGYNAAVKLMKNLKLATLAVSLGNVDSLIEHPASMTHRSVPPSERLRAKITDGLVRFSVGIENVEDIIADFEQSLNMI